MLPHWHRLVLTVNVTFINDDDYTWSDEVVNSLVAFDGISY